MSMSAKGCGGPAPAGGDGRGGRMSGAANATARIHRGDYPARRSADLVG